ncbi:MAG: hypothetical protein ACI84K_001920 [Pseudohongiellaceae bacterium]|jgi:uncharacterized protein (DUF1499 family)
MLTTLMVIGVLVVLFFIRVFIENNKIPVLGVTQGKFKPVGKKPNNVSTQTDVATKQVETLSFKDSQQSTMNALKKTIEAYGGGRIETETTDYLYVIFTTSLMKYCDDVEFWLDTASNKVHFRSSSRAGYSDMGLNRARYNKIAKLYQAL